MGIEVLALDRVRVPWPFTPFAHEKAASAMTPPDESPPSPVSPAPALPDTDATRAIRATATEVIGALQRHYAALAAGGVRLTDDERRSGTGKLLDGEADVLAQVAAVAADHPSLVVGLAAKDGGTNPHVFEADALRAHLAVHVTARDASRAIAREADALYSLLSDLSLYHGAQARGPILAAYKVLSAVADHDPNLAHALRQARAFFDRPARARTADDR